MIQQLKWMKSGNLKKVVKMEGLFIRFKIIKENSNIENRLHIKIKSRLQASYKSISIRINLVPSQFLLVIRAKREVKESNYQEGIRYILDDSPKNL
jgi:hypothetical protein